MPLAVPQKVTEALVLGPAQRVDLIIDVIADSGETAHLVHLGQQEAFSQVAFEVGTGGATTRRAAPDALPPNNYTPVDLGKATALTLNMEGGAMGGLRTATLGGEEKSMREIVDAGRFWAFNGAAEDIGLDVVQLRRDMNAPEIDEHIATSMRLSRAMGFSGTPSFVIGDSLAPGLIDADQMISLVNQARANN